MGNYQPKVFRLSGGDAQEVDYGGKLIFGIAETGYIDAYPNSSGNLVFTESTVGNGAQVHFGVDDDGLDVKFFGATSGKYALWDESADKFIFASDISCSGAATFTGTVDLSGATVTGMTLTASVVAPDTDDGAALGSASLMWSDLFLASGGVINWLNGSSTLTHSPGTLTLAGSASAQSLVLGTDGTGWSLVAYGDTAGCSLTWDQANDQFRIVQTNAATTGVERSATVSQTHTGIGASAEALAVTLATETIGGTYQNAILGKIDYGTTGAVNGLAGVICAELSMPGGTIAGGVGTYACFEAEIDCPTGYDATVPINVFSINAWGAAVGKFDDYGYLFDLTGITSGSDHVWYDNQKAAPAVEEFVRVKTPSGVRYLALYDANA